MVKNKPYVRPIHPGANGPFGATQYETLMQRNEWKRNLVLFKEAADVVKAITPRSPRPSMIITIRC